jgi:hypothetical protein
MKDRSSSSNGPSDLKVQEVHPMKIGHDPASLFLEAVAPVLAMEDTALVPDGPSVITSDEIDVVQILAKPRSLGRPSNTSIVGPQKSTLFPDGINEIAPTDLDCVQRIKGPIHASRSLPGGTTIAGPQNTPMRSDRDRIVRTHHVYIPQAVPVLRIGLQPFPIGETLTRKTVRHREKAS